MVDFHSHILPCIDDGAESVEISLQMLLDSYAQGVRTVIATPHCFPTDDGHEIKDFLRTRDKSYKTLMRAIEEDGRKFPEVKLGCELCVMDDIPDMKRISSLCIEGTNYILTEMPYKRWSVNHYDFIYSLQLKGLRPIMAHIERYKRSKEEFYNLFSFDLLYQVNADSFLSRDYKRFMPYLFENGAVQFLGSDMHNTTTRVSNIKKAAEVIAANYGQDRFDCLMENAKKALNNESIQRIAYPKMSFWEKFKL